MICSNCGQEILDGSKFCINCGTKIEDERILEDSSDASKPAGSHTLTGMSSEVVNVPEGFTDGAAETAGEAQAAAEETVSQVDETLDSAQQAYEQAASDLSDTADQAMGSDNSSSSFYESNETYTASSSDTYEEEGGGNIGFAIASLVCGCLSIFCCWGACISWILSIVAIIMGVITLTKKYDGRGFAIAGIITGGVGIVISIIMLVAMVSEGILNEIM